VAATLWSLSDVRIVVDCVEECVETKAEMQHRGDDDMTTMVAQTYSNMALGREYRAIVGRCIDEVFSLEEEQAKRIGWGGRRFNFGAKNNDSSSPSVHPHSTMTTANASTSSWQ
jgi:hypothetical protein